MNSQTRRELLVFGLLLALGVVGRWAQPAWNVTPLTAIALLGGFTFRSWLPALLLPAAMLAVSDLLLTPHDSLLAAAAVYAMTLLPVALGRDAARREGWRRAGMWGAGAIVPATAFFLVTNLAVWAGKSMYEPTLAGLAHCYTQGLPFYRAMLAGDVVYVALAAGCVAAARLLEQRPATASA